MTPPLFNIDCKLYVTYSVPSVLAWSQRYWEYRSLRSLKCKSPCDILRIVSACLACHLPQLQKILSWKSCFLTANNIKYSAGQIYSEYCANRIYIYLLCVRHIGWKPNCNIAMLPCRIVPMITFNWTKDNSSTNSHGNHRLVWAEYFSMRIPLMM